LARKTFEKILLEAIDESLTSLGNSAKQAIYFHLEKKFKIRKSEIPYRLEDFAKGLERIFGVGAQFIEISIMKQLYGRIGQPLEWNENKALVFTEYITAAKRGFQKKEKEAEV